MAEGAIGWDDEVSEKDAGSSENNEFVVLPPGEYPFTIVKKELGKFKGSEKLSACNMVKIELIVDGGDKGKAYVYHRFYMHTKMLWKIYQFLTAIGLHKKGEGSGPIPWAKVTKGLSGMCKVVVKKVTSGKHEGEDANEVDKWLEPSVNDGEDGQPGEGDDW